MFFFQVLGKELSGILLEMIFVLVGERHIPPYYIATEKNPRAILMGGR